MQYQQRFTPWLALYISVKAAGRAGTDISTMLVDGVNALSGGDIGWLINITQTEKFNLSGTLSLSNLNGNFLNISKYFEDLINNEPYPSVTKVVPALIAGVGLRSAYAFNPSYGLQLNIDYGYGELFTQDSINSWLENGILRMMDPNDWYGHGTTVVGTACSNGRALEDLVTDGAIENNLHGIAPKASIIMVASDFNRENWLASVADGVHFMLAQAEALNRPIVINLSIGSYSGSHDGLDPVGLLINDWFSDDYNGRMLVCAGGNSRTLRYHLGYESTIDTAISVFSSFLGPGAYGQMAFFETWLDTADSDSFKSAIGLYSASSGLILENETSFRSIGENIETTLSCLNINCISQNRFF